MRRSVLMLLLALMLLLPTAAGQAEVEIFQAPKQIVVSFTGDCTLGNTPLERGRASSFESFVAENGKLYPFDNVRDIFLQDDLTVVNLENVFYNREAKKVKKTYNFRSSTDMADILPLNGIEAVSLANNHILDYSKEGMMSTIETLEAQGTGWFCTAEYANQTYIYEKDGIKIGFVSTWYGYWATHLDELDKAFQTLKKAKCNLIVGCMHAGIEYDVRHDSGRYSSQELLAGALIDRGADIVVGHHSHTVQGMKVENGRTILWSLGNFVFGGNYKLRTKMDRNLNIETLIAQFTFSFDEDGTYLGHQLNLIPGHFSSDVPKPGLDQINNYQPILVTGRKADAVIACVQTDTKGLKLKPYVEGVGAIQEFVPAPAP